MTTVKILNLSDNPNPEYKTAGSAGFDLATADTVVIAPGGTVIVPTDLWMIIPEGYEGQIRLRSSMYKRDVVMPNAPGTIDSDYRGQIFIPLRNLSQWDAVAFKKGERIAQMVIKEVPQIPLEFLTSDQFASYQPTSRGEGGFGSTGAQSDDPSL